MPLTTLGKVSLTPQGTYSQQKQYNTLDLVYEENTASSYVAKKPSLGVLLTNEEYWMPMAKGKQGIQGVQGKAATIAVGTTTSGAAGTQATVVNAGTQSAAVFNFTIPKGDKGDPLQIGESYDTYEKLVETYPNGNGNISHKVGSVIYTWNGTAWGATGGISDYGDLTGLPQLGGVELKPGDNSLESVGVQPKGDYASTADVSPTASKVIPVNNDYLVVADSVDGGKKKQLLWGKIVDFMKSLFYTKIEVDTQLEDIRQLDAKYTVEVGTATLTNSKVYPFNNSDKTVSLTTPRDNLNYTVTTEVTAASGCVGEVVVYDKQLNGFKLRFTGSGTQATIKYYVGGGLTR